MISEAWYYSKGDERRGPITTDELKRLGKSGELRPSDLVWTAKFTEWRRADAVPGLMAIIQPNGSIPPIPAAGQTSGLTPTKPSAAEYWISCDMGAKIVLTSSFIAVGSLFLKWVDLGIASFDGFQQQAFLLFIPLAYPVLWVLRKRRINRAISLACVGLSAVMTFAYISSKQIIILDKEVNAAGAGPVVFLLCCIAVGAGVWRYRPEPLTDTTLPPP